MKNVTSTVESGTPHAKVFISMAPRGRFSNRRGVSIGVVVALIIALGMVVDSVIQLTLRTHHRQQDEYLWMDAKHAAEAAIEYGMAKLMDRFNKNGTITYGSLSPGVSPLTLPQAFYETFTKTTGHWQYSRVLANPYDAASKIYWNTRTTELIGGVVTDGVKRTIRGSSPGNEFDPLKDKWVATRSVRIYGKATTKDFRSNRTRTVYACEDLQIRDTPLFADAIFYNMDMEIAPGALMKIAGPVHCNGNIYASSNVGLSFNGQVTASGQILHEVVSGVGKTIASGDVSFTNVSGDLVSMKQGASWIDSNITDYRAKASQLWGGNVQSGEFGVQKENPVAINDYVRDNPDTTGIIDDQLNYAYQLIQPVETATAANSYYDKLIEEQKFAYKSGLTIDVNTTTGTVSMYTYQRNADGTLIYDASGNPAKTSITPIGGNAAKIAQVQKYSASGSGTSTVVLSGIYDYRRGSGISLVTVNMYTLKKALENYNAAEWNTSTPAVSTWWNGVVYVKFSNQSSRAATADGGDSVRIPVDNWGVQLSTYDSTAAKITGEIPNPAFAKAQGIYGTTIATNNPVYVWGNYNADGNSSTGSDGEADSSGEANAAIAGDAITVLSNSWDYTKSGRAISGTTRLAADFTEVSAAFLSGIVPSDKAVNNNDNDSYSGGVENFPRFLESWSNKTFRYRGSMVSLFESEVSNEPWGKSNVYSAPNREWSFSKAFANGYYPPGTPNSRSYRRTSYREMTPAEWKSEMDKLRADTNYWQ